jgi:hypothetical protein
LKQTAAALFWWDGLIGERWGIGHFGILVGGMRLSYAEAVVIPPPFRGPAGPAGNSRDRQVAG